MISILTTNFIFLDIVTFINLISGRAETIGSIAVTKNIGTETNRFWFYFNEMMFAGIFYPTKAVITAPQTRKVFLTFGCSIQNLTTYLHGPPCKIAFRTRNVLVICMPLT
jgi:hypothetical protein